jgi:DHA3 family macrolide efflux protein-like MFS transporter
LKTYIKERIKIFKQPAYFCYFVAAIIATLAMGMAYISNTWLVVSLDHQLSAVIWSFLSFWLPNAIFSPFAGSIIDRLDRKYVVSLSLLALGICYGAFGIVLHFIPALHLYWIYIIYFVMGTLSAFFMPAVMAFMREIISNDELLYANANLDLGYQVGNICGIGIAGYIIHSLGFTGDYILSGVFLIISGLCVLSISDHHRDKTKARLRKYGMLKQFLDDTKDGFNYARTNAPRLVLYISELFLILIIMTTPVLLAPFAKTILHANAIDLSHIEIMMTIGTILGGVLLIYLAQQTDFILVLLLSVFVLVVSILVFSTINTIGMAMICYFCIGFCLGSWSILMSRAQELTDPDYQGRVQAVFSSVTSLGMVMLYLGLSFAAKEINIRHIYWVVGVFAIVPMVLMIRYPKYFRD